MSFGARLKRLMIFGWSVRIFGRSSFVYPMVNSRSFPRLRFSCIADGLTLLFVICSLKSICACGRLPAGVGGIVCGVGFRRYNAYVTSTLRAWMPTDRLSSSSSMTAVTKSRSMCGESTNYALWDLWHDLAQSCCIC